MKRKRVQEKGERQFSCHLRSKTMPTAQEHHATHIRRFACPVTDEGKKSSANEKQILESMKKKKIIQKTRAGKKVGVVHSALCACFEYNTLEVFVQPQKATLLLKLLLLLLLRRCIQRPERRNKKMQKNTTFVRKRTCQPPLTAQNEDLASRCCCCYLLFHSS